jgi:Histidine kinase-, DNA gyrase B-, and HSP90-like ATPase/His Kinase A (phospho-acceptor) domain/Multicopper oxidase
LLVPNETVTGPPLNRIRPSLNTEPGEERKVRFKALNAGLYFYHCATASPAIPAHIVNGMYGAILVEPVGGPPKVDKEFYVVQSEFYTKPAKKGEALEFWFENGLTEHPSHVVFNGMAGGIAHELRNPLVGIGSTASILLDEFEPSDPRHVEIDMILHEAKRMDQIVNQIVEYARSRELVLTQFELSGPINRVLKLLGGLLQAKHLKVRTSISQEADHLYADRDQLEQVLLNVIDNAIDASSKYGLSMEIAAYKLLHQNQPGIMIQVRDAGKGISPEALSRVFEPFFKSGKRNGTGLGMAICKNIVERHRGYIHPTSALGEGTIVSI